MSLAANFPFQGANSRWKAAMCVGADDREKRAGAIMKWREIEARIKRLAEFAGSSPGLP